MQCWKTIDINKEIGSNRLYIFSVLIGILSFIILYLPFSIIHQTQVNIELGFFTVFLALGSLPFFHKLIHLLAILLTNNKAIKVKYRLNKLHLPIPALFTRIKMSKKTLILTLLAPTIFVTVPGLVASYLFAEYFTYFLILATVNIGMSYSDFLCVSKIVQAPKRCIVENDGTSYDILI